MTVRFGNRLLRAIAAPPARVPTSRVSAAGAAAALAIVASAASLFRTPAPLLLWNASSSSPIGLYAVGPAERTEVGDIVVAWPPGDARRLAAARRYLPANVPLVKRVAAVSGARVCGKGAAITIDGLPAALRRRSDGSGRPLPWWSGCTVLKKGDLFLLSPHTPAAFDGRYFGPTRRRDIIGKAKLLWAD